MHSVAKISTSAQMINAIIWKKDILTQKDVQIADSRGAPIGAAAADTVVVVRDKCIPWYAPSVVIIRRYLSNRQELVPYTATTASKNVETQERIENTLQFDWMSVPKSIVSFHSKPWMSGEMRRCLFL